MADGDDVTRFRRAAAESDLVFRRARRLALGCSAVFAIGVCGMALASVLQPSSRRWPGLVSVGLAALGTCGALLLAMRAYAAWGMRRIYEAGVSLPVAADVFPEHRRAVRLAALSCATAAMGLVLMFFADEHRWLGPPAAILFLGGCAGGVHFLQVQGVTRQLTELSRHDG